MKTTPRQPITLSQLREDLTLLAEQSHTTTDAYRAECGDQAWRQIETLTDCRQNTPVVLIGCIFTHNPNLPKTEIHYILREPS